MIDTAHQRVLLVAYGCEPNRGSEAGIGWAAATESARERPTWILVHPAHRGPLCEGVAAWNAQPNVQPLTPVYVDVPGRMAKWEGGGASLFNLYYYAWCREAARVARRLHEEVDFAVAQHVSLTRWWMPTPAATLTAEGVPVLWGPLGAGETVPRPYRRGIGWRGRMKEAARIAARATFNFDPALRRCARSVVGIAEPDETVRRLRSLGVRHIERAFSLPCDLEVMQNVKPVPKPDGVFRVVSGGGLTYWKRHDLVLRAFAQSFRGDMSCEYVHSCDGHFRPVLEKLSRSLGVERQVRYLGDIPHTETLRWVASADVYMLTAMRDTSGHLFEAMSAGVPCIVADHLSPRTIVSAAGIRVPVPGGPTRFVKAAAAELVRLREDPAARQALGEAARARAGTMSRQAWGDRLRSLQADAIAGRLKSSEQQAAERERRGQGRDGGQVHGQLPSERVRPRQAQAA
jgi:glycosyltransferase involved in cell wall biosynthesis